MPENPTILLISIITGRGRLCLQQVLDFFFCLFWEGLFQSVLCPFLWEKSRCLPKYSQRTLKPTTIIQTVYLSINGRSMQNKVCLKGLPNTCLNSIIRSISLLDNCCLFSECKYMNESYPAKHLDKSVHACTCTSLGIRKVSSAYAQFNKANEVVKDYPSRTPKNKKSLQSFRTLMKNFRRSCSARYILKLSFDGEK